MLLSGGVIDTKDYQAINVFVAFLNPPPTFYLCMGWCYFIFFISTYATKCSWKKSSRATKPLNTTLLCYIIGLICVFVCAYLTLLCFASASASIMRTSGVTPVLSCAQGVHV